MEGAEGLTWDFAAAVRDEEAEGGVTFRDEEAQGGITFDNGS